MFSFSNKSRTLFWFYLLVVYIIAQFLWWTYSMVDLNKELSLLKAEVNLLKGASSDVIIQQGNELNSLLRKRWIMISSEGAVFLGILLLGVYQIRKTLKREMALGQQQKNFLLSVTHELKSPIASAKLQMQTLLKHELDRERQKKILENAIGDTSRLNSLVDNMLLAAKIENGGYITALEQVNVSDFMNQLMSQTVHTFNYSQSINLAIEPLVELAIDKTNFTSIVLNLLENAVKYSPGNTTIYIALKKKGEQVVLSVSDEGVGISDKDKKTIFDKFYRVGNEETRTAKGTGLGLYIVNYFTKQHNGRIVVRDNIPQGTIFEITFN